MAPVGRIWRESSELFEKLRRYYFGKHVEEAPPLLSERTAFLCAGLFTALYVLPFYLSPTLRASSLNSRDSPTVIKARIRAVGLSCTAATVITIYILAIYGRATPRDVLRLLGFWPVNPVDCVKVLALVFILFIGPVYEAAIVDGGWRELGFAAFKEHFFTSWTGWRNNVVAPLSEELVFRSLVISLCLLAKVPSTRIVFLTPLVFGGAHIHHLIEFLQSRTPPGRMLPPLMVFMSGLAMKIFQFAYTSVFGFFTAFVYLRTGNFAAAVLAHSFCNFMGFPRLWGRVGQNGVWQTSRATPDVAQGKRDDSIDGPVRVGNSLMNDEDEDEKRPTGVLRAVPKNVGAMWTVGYYLLLAVGAYGFYKLLWVLTESPNALATV